MTIKYVITDNSLPEYIKIDNTGEFPTIKGTFQYDKDKEPQWETLGGSISRVNRGDIVDTNVSALSVNNSTVSYGLKGNRQLPLGVILNIKTGSLTGQAKPLESPMTIRNDPPFFDFELPVWETPKGELATLYELEKYTNNLLATPYTDVPVSYAIVDGALPFGLALHPLGKLDGTTIQRINPFQELDEFDVSVRPKWTTPAGSLVAIRTGDIVKEDLIALPTRGINVGYTITKGGLPYGITMDLKGKVTGKAATIFNPIHISQQPFLSYEIPKWITEAGQVGVAFESKHFNTKLLTNSNNIILSIVKGTLPYGLVLAKDGTIDGNIPRRIDPNEEVKDIPILPRPLWHTPVGLLESMRELIDYDINLHATTKEDSLEYFITNGQLPVGITMTLDGNIKGLVHSSISPHINSETNGFEGFEYELPQWNTLEGTIGIAIEAQEFNNSLSVSTHNNTSVIFTVQEGHLPYGLTLAKDGNIGGTLARKLDPNEEASELIITPTPTWVSENGILAYIEEGDKFNTSLEATSNNGKVQYRLLSGQLPRGMSIDYSGTIKGKAALLFAPNHIVSIDPYYDYELPTWLTSKDTVTMYEEKSYKLNLSARGYNDAKLNYTVVQERGTLPLGLTVSSSGELSGKVVQNIDPNEPIVDEVFESPPLWTISLLPSPRENSLYNTKLTVTSKQKFIDFFLTKGELPLGIVMTNNGILSGKVGVIESPRLRTNDPFFKSELPVWNTLAGKLGTVNEKEFFESSLYASVDSQYTVDYGIVDGHLPYGINIDKFGIISGTATARIDPSDTIDLVPDVTPKPNWITPKGTIVRLWEKDPYTGKVEATPIKGKKVSYRLLDGQLPRGMSIDVTGTIKGKAALLFAPKHLVAKPLFDSEMPVWKTVKGDIGTVFETKTFDYLLKANGRSTLPLKYDIRKGNLPRGLTLHEDGAISGRVAHRIDPNQEIIDEVFESPPVWITESLHSPREYEQYNQPLVAISHSEKNIEYFVTKGTMPNGLIMYLEGSIKGRTGIIESPRLLTHDDFLNSDIPQWIIPTSEFTIYEEDVIDIDLSVTVDIVTELRFGVVKGFLPLGLSISNNGKLHGIKAKRIDPNKEIVDRIIEPKPVWETVGGVIAELKEKDLYTNTFKAIPKNGKTISYRVLDGRVPIGMSLNDKGLIKGKAALLFTPSHLLANPLLESEMPVWDTPATTIGRLYELDSFNYSLSATGKNSLPLKYDIRKGSLPLGLVLSEDGVISSKVIQRINPFEPIVDRVFDTPPIWNTSTLYSPRENEYFKTILDVVPQTGKSLDIFITSGELPMGLTLSNKGIIEGVTGVLESPRLYNFVKPLVSETPRWYTPTGNLATLQEYQNYEIDFSVTTGYPTVLRYGIVNGFLPYGFNISNSGKLSGRTIQRMDPIDTFEEIVVHPKPKWVTIKGVIAKLWEKDSYTGNVVATPRKGKTLSYRLLDGQLPRGMSIDFTGTIKGKAALLFNPDHLVERPLFASEMPVWKTRAFIIGTVFEEETFSLAVVAQGKNSLPLKYEVVSGTLPFGMTIDEDGLISGRLAKRLDPSEEVIKPVYTNIPKWYTDEGLLSVANEHDTLDIQLSTNHSLPLWYTLLEGELPRGLVMYGTGNIKGKLHNFIDPKEQVVLDVNAPIIVTESNLGRVDIGEEVSIQLDVSTVDNGTSIMYMTNDRFSTFGYLPIGLSINSEGLISGIVADNNIVSVITFTVHVVDSELRYSHKDFIISIGMDLIDSGE